MVHQQHEEQQGRRCRSPVQARKRVTMLTSTINTRVHTRRQSAKARRKQRKTERNEREMVMPTSTFISQISSSSLRTRI